MLNKRAAGGGTDPWTSSNTGAAPRAAPSHAAKAGAKVSERMKAEGPAIRGRAFRVCSREQERYFNSVRKVSPFGVPMPVMLS
jgi:hypothetical protein